MRDRDVLFHEQWLGLAQPIEGLVFSVPVLGDAQIAPDIRPELTVAFEEQLDPTQTQIANLTTFFRTFLGYGVPGMLVAREALPTELSFYAAEGGQELRPSFALGRGPFSSDDPFAAFTAPVSEPAHAPSTAVAERFFALAWDLTEAGPDLDLDVPEQVTGPWRYPPTAKFERLLRNVGIPLGLLFNGRNLRLVYAPTGETTGHLTFRVEHLQRADGRPLLAALELLLHARRAYNASAEHTLPGLLAESRRRQADVTDALAKQVFEAVEILVAGFESAAKRDASGDRLDWLRPALEAEGDHFYQGVLSLVLRVVFLLYSEDQSLLPVEHATYAEHLSIAGLYQRLTHDAGAHPESMHHRFGAYGQLVALFRAVFFGVKHGSLDLPPRRGHLFDPNSYPFLEGGLPEWTAAVVDPGARADAEPPSLDDGTIHRVLHRLIVFEGQRLSYRTLDVEQIGSVYESLMGYHVLRLESSAVRMGKHGVWVESDALRRLSPTDRARFLKETCGMNPGPVQAIEKALKEAGADLAVLAEALSSHSVGKRADAAHHRAETGRLVLQPGQERRRTGSHYTPRSLTEKVVRRTLEPLLACLGEARTAEQILQLKICDPAMGSGAFLVATCRELATAIVAAWTRSGELAKMVEAYGDAHLHARRLVAQQCLYGVDKNAAAVELAKLSLWLVTLSRKLPFTFVDHALRHGDSLVGLDFKQIESFHWNPSGQLETCRVLLRDALGQAVGLRQQILGLADHEDPTSQSEKRRLLEFAQQAIERARTVADACVGAFFAETKDSTREKERRRRLSLIELWLGAEGTPSDDARSEIAALAATARRTLSPFHWWIEFPEVFFEERPDPLQDGAKNGAALMEGVVGNPPFMAGGNVSSQFGEPYRDWLLSTHAGSHGNADLVAHFFRRAASLLGANGSLGLIATNTIAQGDTRMTGLAQLAVAGWHLYDATDSMQWPGVAGVTVSIVHAAHGAACIGAMPMLGGRPVGAISSRLRPKPERPDPVNLCANDACSYMGSKVSGPAFILTEEERQTLILSERKNEERIFPYLGGEEVNTSPTQTFDRYVISFDQMPLSEASKWPHLLSFIKERGAEARGSARKADDAAKIGAGWWLFERSRPELYAAISLLERCLVNSQVSKHLVFAFQPTGRVFSHALNVFPLASLTAFAVLQSRVHEGWARLLSSSMGRDNQLRYAASDCFANFPFPSTDPHAVFVDLESAGGTMYQERARFMLRTSQGLTKTYNALKDPACDDPRILELRRLHEEMDVAVLAAYGWSDISVPSYCPMTDADRSALSAFDDEVIDRLYVLNEERGREELRVAGGTTRKKATKSKNVQSSDDADQGAALQETTGQRRLL